MGNEPKYNMTWLDLIYQLKRVPYCFLEQPVMVAYENGRGDFTPYEVIELTSPLTDSAGTDEWLEHSDEFYLSLCINDNREIEG